MRHRARPASSTKEHDRALIDVFATAGTFADTGQLAADLVAAVMTTEQVPDISMIRQNTAAFIHDLPAGRLAAMQLVTSRCGGQPARLAAMGEEAFTAAVRAAVRDWGGQKAWARSAGGSSPR